MIKISLFSSLCGLPSRDVTIAVLQYLGKWYEVRRYYPVFFEFSLKCGVAQYALKENDYIEVSNTGTERL